MKVNLKKLVFGAMMTALCVVIGLVCKTYLTFGAIRITFENLPVLLAGIVLGPVYGAVVGIASDLISAPLSGFGINPVITLGAALIGFVSGILSNHVLKKKSFLSITASCITAHSVGSMLVKSAGLLMYSYPIQMVLLRVPLYLAIGAVESYFIYCLLKNKAILNFSNEVKK